MTRSYDCTLSYLYSNSPIQQYVGIIFIAKVIQWTNYLISLLKETHCVKKWEILDAQHLRLFI